MYIERVELADAGVVRRREQMVAILEHTGMHPYHQIAEALARIDPHGHAAIETSMP